MKIFHTSIFKCLVVSFVTVVFIKIFFEIAFSLDFLNPVASTFNDVDLTDIIASRLPPEDYLESDLNIVLVNIADTRSGIAKQLEILNSLNPKIIAIDATFEKIGFDKSDTLLLRAIRKTKSLVLVYKLPSTLDSLKSNQLLPNSLLKNEKNVHWGFADIPMDASSKTVRNFIPNLIFHDSVYNSFSSEIVKMVDNSSYNYLLSRGNQSEVINFRGNNYYTFKNMNDLRAEDQSFFKNKIVIIGYLGTSKYDCIDKFYTPHNAKNIGRSLPDMYGIQLHANILSMILHRNFISNISNSLQYFILFIIFYLNSSLLLILLNKTKKLYGVLSKLFIVLEVVLILYIYIILYLNFSIKLDLKKLFIGLFLLPTFFELINKLFSKVLKEKR